MKTIQMPIIKDYQTLICRTESTSKISVMMTYITEDEEHELDNNRPIIIKRGNITFMVNPQTVYCYGEIDFNTNSEDYKTLATFNWLDHLTDRGIGIPANYNYKTHTCVTPLRQYQYYDTVKPEVVAQYLHGVLGKPERTLIFKLAK